MMKIIGQFEAQCLQGQELALGFPEHPPSSVKDDVAAELAAKEAKFNALSAPL